MMDLIPASTPRTRVEGTHESAERMSRVE